jgi:uncharacterized protein (DUF1778 family)
MNDPSRVLVRTFRSTPHEDRALQRAARKSALSVSDFIRQAIQRAIAEQHAAGAPR